MQYSTVRLKCGVDANPDARTYNFYFNGNSSSGVFNITVKEDGEYTCVPVNSEGTGSNATVSIMTVVAPSVHVSISAMVIVEGGNISLRALVSGNKPSIYIMNKNCQFQCSPYFTIINYYECDQTWDSRQHDPVSMYSQ